MNIGGKILKVGPSVFLFFGLLFVAECSTVRAGLVINLRFTDGTTTHNLGPGDVGSNTRIQIWAHIDNIGGNVGTGSFYSLGYVALSVISNRNGAGVDGDLQSPTQIAPFNAPPTQVGTLQKLSPGGVNDNITDLGSLIPDLTGDVALARSGTWVNYTGPSTSQIPVFSGVTQIGAEFLVETVDFHVTSLNSGSTQFSVLVLPVSSFVPGANWSQGSNVPGSPPQASSQNNGAYSAGTNVTFVAVPEPSSLAMCSFGGLAAWQLCRRRRTNSLFGKRS